MHAGGKNPGGKESREDKMKEVKLAGWKMREEKLPGEKNSGESWGSATKTSILDHVCSVNIYFSLFESILQKKLSCRVL